MLKVKHYCETSIVIIQSNKAASGEISVYKILRVGGELRENLGFGYSSHSPQFCGLAPMGEPALNDAQGLTLRQKLRGRFARG